MTYQVKMFKAFHNEFNEETINKWLEDNSQKIDSIVNICQSTYVGGGCITVIYTEKSDHYE